MVLVVAFTVAYALALSLAPAIRLHSEVIRIKADYFLPLAGWLVGVLIMKRAISRKLPNRDLWILPIVSILSGLGLLTIWRLSPSLGLKQTLWFMVGSLIFILAAGTRDLILTLKRYKYVWLLLGLLLIGLTFIVGVNPGDSGPKLWLNVFGLYLQPSEPLKLLMIIYLAAFFSDQIRPNVPLFDSILPTIIITGLAGLLLVGQRDIGTASLFIVIYVLMLTVTTRRRRFLWIFPLVVILAGLIGYFTLPIVRTRLDIWLHPWLDASNASYQLVQAQIAVAVGGLFGTGPGLGSPQVVPVAVSDFIFTAIAEELGLFGTVAVMLLLLLLTMRGILIAQSTKTSFGRYLAFGISAYFATQSFIIIGGNLGLVPLTGITLPFLSYGGSSLVTNLVCVLILLKISTEQSPKIPPDSVRRPYQWMAAAFMVLFFGLVIVNSVYAFLNQQQLVERPENPRWAVHDRFSPRGNILSQKGTELALTTSEMGSFQREVRYPALSNTLGYANPLYGQTGLESSLYPYLRGIYSKSFQTVFWNQLLYNQPPVGSDIRLNINIPMQTRADALLEGQKGAIVLLNAKTGEIYTIATHPYFDANTLNEDWQSLMADKDAPLLNRATQASYPIGTLANTLYLSAYWNNPATETETAPSAKPLDPACLKAMQALKGDLDTLQYGCEATATQLAGQISVDLLHSTLAAYGLFDPPEVALEVAEAMSEETTKTAILQTSSDITTLRASPLQMVMVAATITAEGSKPSPRLVNSYQNEAGDWVAYKPDILPVQVLTRVAAQHIQQQFEDASPSIWYQLGHAQSQDGQPITWYLGGTTLNWHGSPLAIAVVLESDNPGLAAMIGSRLLSQSSQN
jgi:cell division protein FtsW (lipid II flippase)